MSKIPVVAVITRTKNRPTFLSRAIHSVAAQNFKDYIHIIVNDGGDKRQVEQVLEDVDQETRERIKLFHREKSSNAPDTIFNESIDRTDSKYIAIHDDDDTWHPDFLSQTIAALDDGAKGVLVRTDKIIEEIIDNQIAQKKKTQYLPDVRAVNLYRQCIDNQLTPISFIYDRSVYEKLSGYDNTLAVCGDWDFGIRFLMKYNVEFIDPGYALANYHHRRFKATAEGNTSFTGDDDRHRYWSNYLMNKYLRSELSRGELGVGYIMNSLRYNESVLARITASILPAKLVSRLKKRYTR